MLACVVAVGGAVTRAAVVALQLYPLALVALVHVPVLAPVLEPHC
jgi:hypothetical protein